MVFETSAYEGTNETAFAPSPAVLTLIIDFFLHTIAYF